MTTATTPLQLRQYRERHTIRSIRAFDEDEQRLVDVCAHDSIRLYAQRGRWVHRSEDIKQLVAFENGFKIDWTIR